MLYSKAGIVYAVADATWWGHMGHKGVWQAVHKVATRWMPCLQEYGLTRKVADRRARNAERGKICGLGKRGIADRQMRSGELYFTESCP